MQSIGIRARTLWSITGLIALLAFLWLVVTHATSELVIVFFAVVLGEGIRPIVDWLERRGIARVFAILIVVVAALAFAAALIWLILSPLVAQVASLVDDAPTYWNRLQGYLARYQTVLQHNAEARVLLAQLPARLGSLVASQASLILSAPLALSRALFNVIFVLLLVVCWLSATATLSQFVLSFVVAPQRPEARAIMDDLSAKTGGYLRGVAINMGAIGVVSGIGDFALGVPYALLLGVVAALAESIPIAGPFIGGAAAVLVALATFGWQKALAVVALYFVIQQIEGNTLVPLVMNRAISLHPFAIIVALLIGGALLGIPGAILSLPVAAIVKVLVVRVAAPAARRALGT
ncbi:MAG: AI-2E family transporter [Vulcanimicrobiaceae bacterium]